MARRDCPRRPDSDISPAPLQLLCGLTGWGVNTKADCVDSLSAVRAGPPALPRPAYHQGDLLARLGGHHARLITHPVKLNSMGYYQIILLFLFLF